MTSPHSEKPPRIPASEAISWPSAFAILNERWHTSPEEVALWATQGQLNAYSRDPRNGYHLEAVIPFLDEPDTTPAHDLLAGFRFEKRQIQDFVPSAFMSEAGAVKSLSFVPLDEFALGTAYYNPSGRFIGFIDAVKFLLALRPRAPKNPEEIESRIAREVESGRIAPRHPFGHLLSERSSWYTAWFAEGAILMLAKQWGGAELSGWDAITASRSYSEHAALGQTEVNVRRKGAEKTNRQYKESKDFCVKAARNWWTADQEAGEGITRIGELCSELLLKLGSTGLWQPTSPDKIKEWLKDAEKIGELVIPPGATQPGAPRK